MQGHIFLSDRQLWAICFTLMAMVVCYLEGYYAGGPSRLRAIPTIVSYFLILVLFGMVIYFV